MSRIRPHPRSLFTTMLLLFLLCAVTALAQTTTATLRGRVVDAESDPVAGAEINAINTATGNNHQAVSGSDGRYLLAGLRPGTYTIVVATPAHEPKTETLTLLVGQNINVDFSLAPSVVLSESITVVGQQVVEMESTQIATSITPTQIEQLPQNNRNFMNFAALAPGVTISDDETRKTFQSGARTAEGVNVFIDGVSFKNDVIQGGVVGQDSSRGNPFPQNAVQEFRVLTQNYAAEFQKAESAVITAVTKSGTNEIAGEVFAFYQDNDLVDENPLTGTNPFFERLQTGASLGGPIIENRLHYFLSYEGNDQERNEIVRLGGDFSRLPAALQQELAPYAGEFPSEFELGLFFGKLSWQPGPTQTIDFSAFLRDETDVRGFGNEDAFSTAESIANDVMNIAGRHQYTASAFFNEASVSYQDYQWNPQALNDIPARHYLGVIRVGGKDSTQDISQQRLSLRDDLTFAPIELAGSHSFKVGGQIDMSTYDFIKDLNGNPVFWFRSDENYARPYEAIYGLGDPEISADNDAWGIYAQDEWSVTDRFMVNLGIRWDYESNMFPTDWVTPADIVQKYSHIVDAEKYFTDGNDRQAIDDMFAPRLGLTYDVSGTNRTVFFGGWGRYYDRHFFNLMLDERFRLQYKRGQFLFSETGAPLPDGRQTVAWNDRYYTEAGLQELLAQGRTGLPEAYLIANDTQAPYSDQWTLGVRQSLGDLVGSLSYGNIQSYNGFTYGWGHRNSDGTCCRWGEVQSLGYGAIITSQDAKRTWYEAIYLQLDKPFTADSIWGGGLAYTGVLNAEGIGGDFFSFDYPTVEDYPRRPINYLNDHKLTANVLFRLPMNFNIGTVVSYGSGYRYDIYDRSAGGGPLERIDRGGGEGDAYLTADLRLEYNLPLAGMELGILGEAFNITNDEIFNSYHDEIFTLPNVNPNFGKPRSIVPGSQRRFQYGVRLRF